MASSVKPVFSDSQGLCCPICLDVYTAPKNLPCLHTYCQHCLHKYIVKNVPDGNKGVTFSCPECRKETFPPLPGISVDEWAEHYPYNIVLLSLLPPEKRKVDKNCDSCLFEGNSVRATSYCTVCKETICPACETVHKKNKASRDHTVVNIQDLFTNPELAVSLSVSVTCSEHVGKEFEFYCKSHNNMCCSECFYKSHKGCTEVHQLKDHSERLLKEKESSRVVDRLKQLRSHLDQFRNENEESFKKIEAEVKNLLDEIDMFRKKINILLDNVIAKITMETNALLKEESIVQHEENQQCESISSAVTNSLHLLETVLAHGNTLHVLATLHKTEEQLFHYESAVKEKYCEVRHIDAKLCLDDRLLSLIKCSDTTIIKIDLFETKQACTFSPIAIEKTDNTNVVKHDVSRLNKKAARGDKQPQEAHTSKPLKECKPVKIGQFNADDSDGMTPGYIGVAFLPDDKIMHVDSTNFKSRLFDSSYQNLADYKLTSGPSSMCVVEGSQVAVTLHDAQGEWKPSNSNLKPSGSNGKLQDPLCKSPNDESKVPKDESKPPKDEEKPEKNERKLPKDDWKPSFWMFPKDEWQPPKDDWKAAKAEWKLQHKEWKPPKDEWKPPAAKWTPPEEAAVSTPRKPKDEMKPPNYDWKAPKDEGKSPKVERKPPKDGWKTSFRMARKDEQKPPKDEWKPPKAEWNPPAAKWTHPEEAPVTAASRAAGQAYSTAKAVFYTWRAKTGEWKPSNSNFKPPSSNGKPQDPPCKSPNDESKPPKDEEKPPKDEWKPPKDEWKPSFWMAPKDEWKPPKDEWKPPKAEWKLQPEEWKPPKDEWKPPTAKWTPPKEAAVSTPREPGPMGILMEMGFFNREQNRRLLQKHENNVQAVIQELLQSSDQNWMNKSH